MIERHGAGTVQRRARSGSAPLATASAFFVARAMIRPFCPSRASEYSPVSGAGGDLHPPQGLGQSLAQPPIAGR